MHRPILDMLVIGFALFSMFFGAGNVIFPPYLGLSCGAEWFAGFAWYYLADIGLALLALFAVLRCGSTEKVMGRLGVEEYDYDWSRSFSAPSFFASAPCWQFPARRPLLWRWR